MCLTAKASSSRNSSSFAVVLLPDGQLVCHLKKRKRGDRSGQPNIVIVVN